MHHYRRPWEHQISELEQAARLSERIKEAVSLKSGKKGRMGSASFQHSFISALEQDLDTPTAFETLSRFVNEIIAASRNGKDIKEAQETLRSWNGILGLRIDADRPDTDVLRGWDQHLMKFEDT
jgi:cysteinyl-tRNA synthetase